MIDFALQIWSPQLMKNTHGSSGERRTKAIGSVMRLRREIYRRIKPSILEGSSLTYEEADLLCDLYGAQHLGWPQPELDTDGRVPLANLRASVQSPELLSRRIAKLENGGLIERTLNPLDRRQFTLSVTKKGIAAIQPVYAKFKNESDQLLGILTDSEVDELIRINEKILSEIG